MNIMLEAHIKEFYEYANRFERHNKYGQTYTNLNSLMKMSEVVSDLFKSRNPGYKPSNAEKEKTAIYLDNILYQYSKSINVLYRPVSLAYQLQGVESSNSVTVRDRFTVKKDNMWQRVKKGISNIFSVKKYGNQTVYA